MSLPARKNKAYPAIIKLKTGRNTITAVLSDGREVTIPLAWFSRLAGATKKQLSNYRISPAGYGIHWPDIDEDISIKAFLD